MHVLFFFSEAAVLNGFRESRVAAFDPMFTDVYTVFLTFRSRRSGGQRRSGAARTQHEVWIGGRFGLVFFPGRGRRDSSGWSQFIHMFGSKRIGFTVETCGNHIARSVVRMRVSLEVRLVLVSGTSASLGCDVDESCGRVLEFGSHQGTFRQHWPNRLFQKLTSHLINGCPMGAYR